MLTPEAKKKAPSSVFLSFPSQQGEQWATRSFYGVEITTCDGELRTVEVPGEPEISRLWKVGS